jgi:large subunit ribosomal protein L25
MERVSLVAQPRFEVGKNAAKRLRLAGMVPAVVYGRGARTVPLAIERKALLGALHTEAGRNVLIDLQIQQDGQEQTTVMIADVQHDYLRREVVHLDLHQISLTERVEARVPVVLAGVPEGVTAGGGILSQHLREVTVRCLPTAIPEHLTVDVSGLRLGASLHVRDLPAADGIEVLTPPEEVIAAVVAPKEEAAPAAAEAPAPGEPEVVGKEGAPGEPPKAEAPRAEARPARAEKTEKGEKKE